jgi:hypothetical protein
MLAVSENLWPFKAIFSFGNSQKSHGANCGEHGGWSNFIIDFLAKNSRRARHEQRHCHDAKCKQQAKVLVFSDEQPRVTLPVFPNNNAGSLFDLVEETQSEQYSCGKKSIVFT